MTTTPLRTIGDVSSAIAAELRAALARADVSQRQLADRIDRPQAWISRRIGRGADVEVTFEDVALMAQALGVDTESLVVPALRACRDSNPKPSDLYLARVIAPFVLGRCPSCGAWTYDGVCTTPHTRSCHGGLDAVWVLAA